MMGRGWFPPALPIMAEFMVLSAAAVV